MLTDIKLSRAQLSKIIQSGGCPGKTLGNMMGNLHKKALIDLAVPLVKDVLHKLATKATSFRFDKFERKISGRGAIRAGKEFPLFISNEDMDIIQTVESLEKSGLLIDGATETVKHEIKKQEGGFIGAIMPPMASSLMQPVASSLINAISDKGQEAGFLPLFTLPSGKRSHKPSFTLIISLCVSLYLIICSSRKLPRLNWQSKAKPDSG